MDAKRLRIGMVDVDLMSSGTRFPNLAQMKMSAYCRSRGCDVVSLYKAADLDDLDTFDAVLVSKVFTFSEVPEKLAKAMGTDLRALNLDIREVVDALPSEKTVYAIGGTGFFEDGGRRLCDEIEHIMPDYHLYDAYVADMQAQGKSRALTLCYTDFSIGFTSRGCFRGCDFCVNRFHDRRAVRHSPVSEFLDPSRKYITCQDDNILGCKDWEAVMDELEATGKPFHFKQGMDIRLMSDKKASRLASCKYYGDYTFAFDRVDDFELIYRKLKLWRSHTDRSTKLYLICAFDPVDETPAKPERPMGAHVMAMRSLPDRRSKDQLDLEFLFERIRVCMSLECLPYVMRFEAYKDSEYRDLYVQLARWCNQPSIFKKKSFREFCIANQEYAKSDKPCATMKAMMHFESDRPDLAERYFDMKFGEPETLRKGVWELGLGPAP